MWPTWSWTVSSTATLFAVGALAMAEGRTLLPYRTREDTYISAWELLVAGPARRGEDPPPVFLLVNEAAHIYTRDDGQRTALVDDMLWAPFSIARADLLELYVHALSPSPDQLPTRVARHELRMALLELRVDPEAIAAIETRRFEPGQVHAWPTLQGLGIREMDDSLEELVALALRGSDDG